MSASATKAAPAHKATPHAVKPEVEPIARVGTITKAVNRVIDRYEHDVARFVKLEHRALNQRDELVCRLRRAALMKRRPADARP